MRKSHSLGVMNVSQIDSCHIGGGSTRRKINCVCVCVCVCSNLKIIRLKDNF